MSQRRQQVSQPSMGSSAIFQSGSPYRFVIGGLTVLLNFSINLSFFAVAPITPLIMNQYGLNRSAASLLVGVVVLVQSLLAIPISMMAGRVGLKKLFAIMWFIAAIPSLSFLAPSFPILLVLRMAYGLSFAVMPSALGPLVMQWFRPRELPVVNGINTAAGSLGVAVATFAGAPLAEAVGWRVALSLFGLLALLGAGLWLVLGRVQQPAQTTASRPSMEKMSKVLRARSTLLLALA